MRARVEENARVQQRKRSAMADRQTDSRASHQPAKRSPVSIMISGISVHCATVRSFFMCLPSHQKQKKQIFVVVINTA